MNISCATYNILHGRYKEMIFENLRTLRREGVDIFCLQETPHEFEKDILKFLEDEGLEHWKSKFAHEGAGGHVGMVWNTDKLTLIESHVIHLPSLGRPSNMQRLKGSTSVYQRVALLCTFKCNGSTLNVITTHLAWEGGFTHRLKQLAVVRKTFETHRADHDVVCGDFNTTGTKIFSRLQKQRAEEIFGSDFTNVLPSLKWTWDTSFSDPQLEWNIAVPFRKVGVRWRSRLDYIFCRNLTVEHASMHDLPGSDHRPLVATLSFKKPPTRTRHEDAFSPLRPLFAALENLLDKPTKNREYQSPKKR